MAISQLDDDTETIEEALARANAEALAAKNKDKYPCAACGYGGPCDVDLADLEAIRSLCREELVLAIRENSGKIAVVAAIRELLDRVDGKPNQSIQTTNTVEQNYNLTVRFVGANGKIIENPPQDVVNAN